MRVPSILYRFLLRIWEGTRPAGGASRPPALYQDRQNPYNKSVWGKKVQSPPKPICSAKNKLEGVDLRRKMQGLRNSHLLYGPSWWQQKSEKGQGVGWVNSTGPHLQEHAFCINTLGNRSDNVGKFYMAPPSRTCFLYKHIGAKIWQCG